MARMAAPTHSAAPQLELLGTLVTQQRLALGYRSKEKAAAAIGLSHVPYRNVENGKSAGALTYQKIETGFGMVAGSCQAVLDGADSIRLIDGGELIDGARSYRLTPQDAESKANAAIEEAIAVTAPDISVGQANRIKALAVEGLRQRGVLPKLDTDEADLRQ